MHHVTKVFGHSISGLKISRSGPSCIAIKKSAVVPVLPLQVPRFEALLTLCRDISLAWRPMHPIIVSGGPEGSIHHWDLSSPTAGTPAMIVPTAAHPPPPAPPPHQRQWPDWPSRLPPPPRAMLSQAHDPNIWALTCHFFGHLLIPTSNGQYPGFSEAVERPQRDEESSRKL